MLLIPSTEAPFVNQIGRIFGVGGYELGFRFRRNVKHSVRIHIYIYVYMWVVVKIMVPFWIPIIIRHLIFRVRKEGPYL